MISLSHCALIFKRFHTGQTKVRRKEPDFPILAFSDVAPDIELGDMSIASIPLNTIYHDLNLIIFADQMPIKLIELEQWEDSDSLQFD